MVKKRKKKKPKRREKSRAGSVASAGADGASSAPEPGEDSVGGDGLAARGLLLDALQDSTPRPPDLDAGPSAGGPPDLDADDEAPSPDEGDEAEAPDEDAYEDEDEVEEERKLPAKPVQIPMMGDGADDDEDEEEAPSSRAEAGDDEDEDEDEMAAAQMGSARYVIFGFFALWLVSAYVAGKALMALWGMLGHRDWFSQTLPAVAAVPHEGELISRTSVSLVLGALIAGGVVLRYYTKADVRQWADEVAEQLSKVKWPTRKEVGQNTVVVLAVASVLTTILTLLDRFWGFVTNLIYAGGL